MCYFHSHPENIRSPIRKWWYQMVFSSWTRARQVRAVLATVTASAALTIGFATAAQASDGPPPGWVPPGPPLGYTMSQPPAHPAPAPAPTSDPSGIVRGNMVLVDRSNPSAPLALDALAGRQDSGSPVGGYPPNGGRNQSWTLKMASGLRYAPYTLINDNSGLCLTTTGSVDSTLIQATCVSSSVNQQFWYGQNSDSTYSLTPVEDVGLGWGPFWPGSTIPLATLTMGPTTHWTIH